MNQLMRSTGAQPYVYLADVGVPPVTATEVFAWLNITDPATIIASSPVMNAIIAGCTYEAEVLTKRLFYPKQYKTFRDVFGDYGDSPAYAGYPAYTVSNTNNIQPISIRRTPLNTVQQITYYDADNVLQTLLPTDYYITPKDAYSLIYPTVNWAETIVRQQAIEIIFVAGYTTLPPNLKLALLEHCANAYMNRGDCGCECKSAPSSVQGAYRAMMIVDIV